MTDSGNMLDGMLDQLLSEIVMEIHREIKFGAWSRSPHSSKFQCLCPVQSEKNAKPAMSHDLLGHPLGVPINQTFHCVHCGRSVVATRYAPHLEKCMGFGRNSSRIANRKLANYQTQEIILDMPQKRNRDFILDEDYEEDSYEEESFF